MPTTKPVDTVARIEAHRKMLRMSRTALAERAGFSLSLYNKIASGHKRATPAVVNACARALGVDPTELYGQPYWEQLRADQIGQLIQPLVDVLDLYDLDPDGSVRPRTVVQMDASVQKLGRMHDAGAFGQMARTLPGLIEEIRSAAMVSRNPVLWDLLARAYRAVYDVGIKFGYPALARTCMDRVQWAAGRAGDASGPLTAMAYYQRSLIQLKGGQYAAGLRMYRAGWEAAWSSDDRVSMAVRGQLMLGAALLSARSGAADDAHALLDDASRLAEEHGDDDVYWMGWGPTNVDVHRVAVWAELDEPGRAVEAARVVRLREDWAPSRVARHWVTVAGVELWAGCLDRSLEALQTARHAAPQAVRYNPDVKDTVGRLLRSAHGSPEELLSFAQWADVRH